jgi:hypothetical protein
VNFGDVGFMELFFLLLAWGVPLTLLVVTGGFSTSRRSDVARLPRTVGVRRRRVKFR